MRAWAFGAPLAAGVWGIREPKPDAPEVAPDILLVPLLSSTAAATARLRRRLLRHDDCRAARAEAGHCHRHAFAAQEIEAVPDTPRDARLDYVLTENEVITIFA
jgi:5-formyltetrahydrofolate cyclo-ligase